MKPNSWPLPQADEIIEDPSGSTVFSTVDFWQIKMDEACKEKTTFVCKYDTYQSKSCPLAS